MNRGYLVNHKETHRIHRRIAGLARELHNRPAGEGSAVIDELALQAAQTIPGAQYAGITVTNGRSKVTTAAKTHRIPELLDAIQQQHRQGPCLVTASEHHTVWVDDLTTETRWPAYRRAALDETPVRSLLSFELFTTQHNMGALNVYAEAPHAFDDDSREIGVVFATHAALVWDSVRREQDFRSALASRDMIGQAKGMLMERFQVDAVRAFELLKQLSQESNKPLWEIAQRLVRVDGGLRI